MTPLSRRRTLAWAAAGAAAAAVGGFADMAGCSRRSGARRVVLYSSVDDALLQPIIEQASRATGLTIETLRDTEATKTTGLALRLLSEKSAPRCDVWWSSEALASVKLAREGVLEPYRSPSIADGWPATMHAPDFAWTGFASRLRVIAHSTSRVPPDVAATLSLPVLAAAKLRVGMARPQFGTTRSHMAAIAARFGDAALRAWLRAAKGAGIVLYDGNASVVRAIAQGEIDAGLTDSDDALAARREGWPVGFVFEPSAPDHASTPATLEAPGPLRMPNTIGLVRAGPNPDGGRVLIDHLLSADVERFMARSESGNAPVRPALAAEFPATAVPGAWSPDWAAVDAAVETALRLCDEELGGL